MARKKNTCSLKELVSMEYETIAWKNEAFRELVGDAESRGSWIVWGKSFNGKSSFAMKLMQELAEIGYSVLYVSNEEGFGKSLRDRVKGLVGLDIRFMKDARKEDLEKELHKQRSAKCIIVDSIQYLGINQAGYNRLRRLFPNKLWVWISHANDKEQPKGIGDYVRYDSDVKIVVSNFVANANSRFGGGKSLVVWDRKADMLQEKDNLEEEK